MLNKILVAIDDSAASRRAFDSASELARALNAELILVHALDVFDPASPQHPMIPVENYSMQLDKMVQQNYQQQWTEFVGHSEALLKQQQQKAEERGVTATHVLPYGRPGPAICKIAETLQADLIVVGSRGRNGLREIMLGSVSNYIMHHAPCSVTVVHPYGDDANGDDEKRTQEQRSTATVV
ncbi:MAG: universal stress protein [Cyanobacteria bacterium J06581_3]